MSTNQGLLQQSIRDITGTQKTYNEDWIALFDFYEIAQGTFNERLILFLQDCLDTSESNLVNLQNSYALEVGVYNWNSLTDISLLLPNFLPNNIDGLVWWYESFDTSTIADTTNLVDTWTDKSSNAYVATGTTTTRPTTNTNTLNTNNVIYFNSDRLILPSDIYTLPASANTLVFLAQSNDTSGVKIIYNQNTASVGNAHSIYYNGSSQVVFKNTSTGGGDLFANNIDINSFNIIVCTFDGVNEQKIYVNGVELATNNFGSTPSGITGAAIGGTTTSGSFDGNIGASMAYNKVLSTAERHNVEGYIAWKYQITEY
jgi:hypothetical protein